MSAIQLTDDELRILQDHRKGAPHKLMRLKSEAIIMLSMGTSKKFAAEFVERSIETIKRWVRQWNESGLESIRTGHAGNDNASKLTREQAEETREALSRPPSEQGIPADFWDVPRLAGWMHEHFNVEYRSRSSYHRRFRMAELSFHRPVGVDRRCAPEAEIEARMEQIDAEIARIAGRERDGRKKDGGQRGLRRMGMRMRRRAARMSWCCPPTRWASSTMRLFAGPGARGAPRPRSGSTGNGSPRSTSGSSTNQTGGWTSCDWSGATPTTS